MELHGVGPVVWIDTAGFDDEGALGELRIQKSEDAMDRTDIALLLFTDGDAIEQSWLQRLKAKKIPIIPIISKTDLKPASATSSLSAQIQQLCGEAPLLVSASTGQGMREVRERLVRLLPEDYQADSIVGHLVRPGDNRAAGYAARYSSPQGAPHFTSGTNNPRPFGSQVRDYQLHHRNHGASAARFG